VLRTSRGLSHRPSRMRPPDGIPGTPGGIACGQQETLQGESACGHRRITILPCPQSRVCLEAQMRWYCPTLQFGHWLCGQFDLLKWKLVKNVILISHCEEKFTAFYAPGKSKIIFLKLFIAFSRRVIEYFTDKFFAQILRSSTCVN